jgi:hypothetical protein
MRYLDGMADWPRLQLPFKDETDIVIGIAVGMNKGHVVRRRELPPRPSRRRGVLSTKTQAVRSLIKEVCGYLLLNLLTAYIA